LNNDLSFFHHNYTEIIAKPDLEGYVSAGMIKKLFPISVNFANSLSESTNRVIIEIDDVPLDSIHNNLIIDHRLCDEYISVMGNFIICDRKLLNSPHVISEYFDIPIDDLLLDLIFSIETSAVLEDEIEELARTYLINHRLINTSKIIDLASKGDWIQLIKLIENMERKEKEKNIEPSSGVEINKVNEETTIVGYEYYSRDGYYRARYVSKILQLKGNNIFLVEMFEGKVFQGYIIGLTKSLIKKIFKKIKNFKIKFEDITNDVIFFRIYTQVTIKELLDTLAINLL